MDRQVISASLLRYVLLATPLAGAVSCVDGMDAEDRDERYGDQRDAEPFDAADTDAGTEVLEAGAPLQGDAQLQEDAQCDSGVQATGDTYGYTSTKRIVLFDRSTGWIASSVQVTGVADAETILGLDVRPADGSLIALSSASKLYRVDLQTGVATLSATLSADAADTSDPFTALSGATFGLDFNPVPDRLRIVSDTGQNLRVNVDTGATTTDGLLNPAAPGVSAAAYTNSFASACRTRLFVVDAAARKLLLQDPPNDGKLTEIGGLGDASPGEVRGFEIIAGADGSNLALAAIAAADGARFAEIDLTTGAARNSKQLALSAGETLDAIFALPPATPPTQAPGELLAVTAGNRLLSFNRGAPGKLCTVSPIAGLASTESIVGADVRPSDGALYALSDQGKIYTVSVPGGVAALKSTLAADAADTSDPFGALVGQEFGVGFNPVPDRLRVVSNTGVNLRVNVDTGATTTDVALNPAPVSVSAVAYTNSFAGTKSTTLYALDSDADALVRIGGDPANGAACPDWGNPNCGYTTPIGPLNLGGDVAAVNGFDIDATTGTALAALSLGDAATATLYSVNLASGAAALPAGVANGTIGGGERVRALTFRAAPTLTVYGVTSDDKLVAFAPNKPGTLIRSVPIAGLDGGETLLGVDIRPLDGKLYGVGSSGRLYTLDTTTGAASLVAPLSAAAASSFTALPGGRYGFDFNPAADALRLVNDQAQNYRVLPSTRAAGPLGATFVDSPLTPETPIAAAGYTNNFPAPASTTLFVIDAGGGTLYRQGGPDGMPSPNAGELTTIGWLNLPVAPCDLGFGFDIVGGHNGLALAAISADWTSSALYSIDLASGAATAFNAADNAVAAPLRALALELK
jgi:hypothetical protein